MIKKSAGQQLLENAYKLETPEDNVSYYGQFAPTYDTDFASHLGYRYHEAIAEIYAREAGKDDSPIADVGCGTGLVAEALELSAGVIDGMDISPEMLEVAAGKGLYRNLLAVDLTQPLDDLRHDYGAALSAGTFTHGHLGPGPLRNLVTIVRPGGLFVIGVNRAHFDAHGFAAVLDAMVADNIIGRFRIEETEIYAKQGHDHSGDRALIVQFRKS